jgi:arabinogalactan oligomer / maltooligosaccharide transport system substrate-binding protein
VIKRIGTLLPLLAIVVAACSSGGGTTSSSAASAAAPSTAASGAPSSAAASGGASAAAGGGATLTIWADDTRAKAIKPLAQKWAADNGVTVDVEAISQNLTTQFKTASQQGTGPDIVVWAHDAVADFVQNGAISPVQLPDTSGFDPLAVKAMTFGGQLYGVPYSIENIALIRNTDLAPDCPQTMEDLVSTGQQLIKDGKASQIMALQVGQKGDAYHIYPLFTSGGGSYFGTTATGDPDPKNVTVDSPESIAAGQKIYDLGEKGVGALKRSIDDKNYSSLFTSKKTPFVITGPWAIPDIAKSGVPYDICAIPPFKDGKPASPFIGVNGFYLASKGKNPTLAQEFLQDVVPTPEFQVGLYNADPRRPALTAARDQVTATDPNIPKFADAAKNGTILPAIPEMGQVWTPFGIAEASIIGGTDPTTALQGAAKAIRDGIAKQ